MTENTENIKIPGKVYVVWRKGLHDWIEEGTFLSMNDALAERGKIHVDFADESVEPVTVVILEYEETGRTK